MSNYVREFVLDQLEIRGHLSKLEPKQVDEVVHWFEWWFDDMYDTISDALGYAYQDCEIAEPTDEEEDEEPYTPSATAGDYSPSCPWNAPGMSVSDFI